MSEASHSNHDLHVPAAILEAGVASIQASPKQLSVLDFIVRRPNSGVRELPEESLLDEACGLIGDNWQHRGSPDRRPNPDAQLTIMNSRCIDLIAGSKDRWALAGDQLFADLDLSVTNLPAGSRLKVGEAIIEITAEPHLGCGKFKTRYGADALAWVNSPLGRELRLRGANARIISGGTIRVGDAITLERTGG
jgi:hypothetical protein